MIELENDIFIGCNPADCTLMCHQLKWLECTSSGRKYHSLMMDPLACFITLFWSSVNTLRILGVSAFGERLFIGQLTALKLQRLESNPSGMKYSDQVDHYLVRFLPSFTTPRTNILDIRGQFSRIHLGLKLISEMGLEIHACFPIFKNSLRELVSDYRRDHITGIYRKLYLGTIQTFTIFGVGSDDLI